MDLIFRSCQSAGEYVTRCVDPLPLNREDLQVDPFAKYQNAVQLGVHPCTFQSFLAAMGQRWRHFQREPPHKKKQRDAQWFNALTGGLGSPRTRNEKEAPKHLPRRQTRSWPAESCSRPATHRPPFAARARLKGQSTRGGHAQRNLSPGSSYMGVRVGAFFVCSFLFSFSEGTLY